MPTARFKLASENRATAFFHASYGQPSIDKEAGILRGVKLMELGKVATFSGPDNKPVSVKITDAHISALLGHAGNRALPIHETHEWFDAEGTPTADSVERAARIGALKAFRKDESGNLIADALLNLDKQPARDLLFGAENNPEDNCFSVVFSYDKNDPQCIPMNFRAGDVVPRGAATTALFSEAETKPKSMDISELITMLDDPKAKDAIKAIVKSHKDAEDADGAEADTAAMSAAVKTEVEKQLAETKTALLAEVKLQVGAEATALLGQSGLPASRAGEKKEDDYTALLADYAKTTGGNTVKAAARLIKDRPELLPQYEIHTRARLAKLSPQS